MRDEDSVYKPPNGMSFGGFLFIVYCGSQILPTAHARNGFAAPRTSDGRQRNLFGFECGIFNAMINDYISSYLEKARYEIIDNGKTFYAEIPALKGVWATGKTLEGCRKELASVLEGWIILHLRNNWPIPGFKLPRLKMREKAYA